MSDAAPVDGWLPAARTALSALCIVAVMVACTPQPEPSTAPPPVEPGRPADPADDQGDATAVTGSLRIAVPEPVEITPADASGPGAELILGALFEPLTRIDSDGQVAPAAASRWELDDDGVTWRFTLRAGAAFHDGTPVRAGDFVFAWTLAVAEGANGYLLRQVQGYPALREDGRGELSGVRAPDERTLEVALRAPDAEWPLRASHPALAPVPFDTYRDAPEDFIERPVGNGPFAMAEPRSRGSFVRLSRAGSWRVRDRAPALDEVLFRFGDPADAFVAFQQGRVDVAPVPDGALAAARATAGRSSDGLAGPGVIDGPVPSLYFLAFDLERPPFDDVRVRQAISLAVDRPAIAEAHLDGNLDPAFGLVPPPLVGSRDEPCRTCQRNLLQARTLLAQADVDRIELWYTRGGGHQAIAEQIRDQLAQVGLRVVLRSQEFATFIEAVGSGEAPAPVFRFGWTAEHLTPSDVLGPLFASDRIGESNVVRWSDARTDRLLGSLQRTTTPRAQRYYVSELEDIILEQQLVVPLFTYRHATVVGAQVEGWRQDPLGRVDLTAVRLVD